MYRGVGFYGYYKVCEMVLEMVGTQRCSFCGRDIEPGTGSAFVQTKDGAVSWFCSNKCKTNRLKRRLRPRDTKWTEGYEKGGKAAR